MPRFPHVIWKRDFGMDITTQLAPSGFTYGDVCDKDYARLQAAHAPALIFDSEILHRGAATPMPAARAPGRDAATEGAHGVGWVSSCSVELCSAAGWDEWVHGTGGTEFSAAPEYRMLPIAATPRCEA